MSEDIHEEGNDNDTTAEGAEIPTDAGESGGEDVLPASESAE